MWYGDGWCEEKIDRLWAMEVFIRVAECGSFSRASESLNLANATVSTCVRNLEEYLGVNGRNIRQHGHAFGGTYRYCLYPAILDIRDHGGVGKHQGDSSCDKVGKRRSDSFIGNMDHADTGHFLNQHRRQMNGSSGTRRAIVQLARLLLRQFDELGYRAGREILVRQQHEGRCAQLRDPRLFSTTTLWPIFSVMACATNRASWPVPPPGANPTSKRTGRDGSLPAKTLPQAPANHGKERNFNAVRRDMLFTGVSGALWLTVVAPAHHARHKQ